MYNGYRVRVLMFAGRARFMRINLPYLQNHPLVDEILVGDNVVAASDREYVMNAYREFPKIRYVEQMKDYTEMHMAHPELSSLQYWNFYLNAADPSAVYLKLDDDIVYIGDGCIENMLARRFSCPDALLVYATTVNNPLANLLFDGDDLKQDGLGELMYRKFSDLDYAVSTHRRFLSDPGSFRLGSDFSFGPEYTFALPNHGLYIRPSINAVCWFGFDMANWIRLKNRIRFIYDDEQFMCKDLFDVYDRRSVMVKDAVVSHYSFGSQKGLKDYEKEFLPAYARLMGVEGYAAEG